MQVKSMIWKGDHLLLLDQRQLPHQETWLKLSTWEDCTEAIKTMAVRGAPAIAICGSYGLALAAQAGDDIHEVAQRLLATRPTAVNLQTELKRLLALSDHSAPAIEAEAVQIEAEDREICQCIGQNGLSLLPARPRILTICNTGALATGGDGTALAIIRAASHSGFQPFAYSCETRPRLQGLRLTAWELLQEEIPFASIADSAAAILMQSGKVDIVLVGADRIATNGDTANKIGTLSLAILAHHFKIPFVVAAPSTTFDPATRSGHEIEIEERAGEEITHIEGVRIAPDGTPTFNPAFDVTPAALITSFVTETGVVSGPYDFSKGAK